MKKMLSILLVFVLIFSISCTATAADFVYPEGDLELYGNFEVVSLSDGTMSIIRYLGGEESDIVIPEKINNIEVSRIDENAFSYPANENIKRITLPDTIKTICFSAFGGCINLEYINLPDSITFIHY